MQLLAKVSVKRLRNKKVGQAKHKCFRFQKDVELFFGNL